MGKGFSFLAHFIDFGSLGKGERRRLVLVALLRCLFIGILVHFLNRIFEIGTSPLVVSAGTCVGVLVASTLAFSRLTSLGFATLLGGTYLAYSGFWWGIGFVPPSFLNGSLALSAFELHLDIVCIGALLAAATTWLFWRTKHALTLEVLALVWATIHLLSGHRGLKLDQPSAVHALAWSLGWSPIAMLVAVGVAVVAALFGFLLLSSPPGRPEATRLNDGSFKNFNVHHTSGWSLRGATVTVVLASLLYGIGYATFAAFSKIAGGSVTMMGVGQEDKEELSPLGFHSSLGKNSQPSALVRLEGDYAQNPFSPMLYFRESALSGFSGNEMVIAPARYDTDVNRSRPDESYSTEPDTRLLSRTPLVQSVFLLAEHKTAFAIDFPLEIRQLKNPNPGRFNSAYKAYSVAPGFALQELAGGEVGDPDWDQETKAHYLTPHPDKRYEELARKIVGDTTDPIARLFLVNQWFSEHAIYTLTPGHEMAPDEDPVAAFLFGDMRGYCVHFAHAMVYLYRALGIPARIGTGYLTDLSQARDGHILLRMNDRHAWSEVYIAGRGWIPFDPQPQQVENHGESPVDMKTLEELMGMVGPTEEILPKDVAADEAGIQEEPFFSPPDWKYPAGAIAGLLVFLALVKVLLLSGWRLARDPLRSLQLRHRSTQALLYDLGFRRSGGETRHEFRARLAKEIGSDPLPETDMLVRSVYDPSVLPSVLSQLSKAAKVSVATLPLPKWKRFLGYLNPSSAFAVLTRRVW